MSDFPKVKVGEGEWAERGDPWGTRFTVIGAPGVNGVRWLTFAHKSIGGTVFSMPEAEFHEKFYWVEE